MVGETSEEILKCDLAAELNAAYLTAENGHDYVTSEMIRLILESEEGHILWLQQQIGIIGSVGIQNCLQSQV